MRLLGVGLACVCILISILMFSRQLWEKERPLLLITSPAPRMELLPVYIGVCLGYFETNGIEAQIVNTAVQDEKQKQTVLKTCEIEEVLYARAFDGAKNVAITVLSERDCAVLLGRSPEPFTWDEMRENSVITAGPSSATTAVLEETLRENKVRPHREVTLMQNIPEELRIPVFLAGTGDYIVVSEPLATVLIEQKKAFPAARIGDGKPLPRTVIAAGEDWAIQNPALTASVEKSLTRARAYIYSHSPAELACLTGPFFPNVSLSTLEKVIARGQSNRTWGLSGKANADSFNGLQEILKQAGELPRPLVYEEVFKDRK
ncbi:MAG: hypothetical protein AB1500_04320 [Bacillota bacterium]